MNRTIEERNKLVEENIKLVNETIKKYISKASIKGLLSYEDLEQTGRIGLMAAAESYDESKDVEFSTYAVATIKHKIYNAYIKEKRYFIANQKYEPSSVSYSENYRELENSVRQVFDEIKLTSSSGVSKGIKALELVIDGYSYIEIATILETTPENVKAYIYRARQELKKESKFSFLHDELVLA